MIESAFKDCSDIKFWSDVVEFAVSEWLEEICFLAEFNSRDVRLALLKNANIGAEKEMSNERIAKESQVKKLAEVLKRV